MSSSRLDETKNKIINWLYSIFLRCPPGFTFGMFAGAVLFYYLLAYYPEIFPVGFIERINNSVYPTTPTPYPTYTAYPTYTPYSTSTPYPIPTLTPSPTFTPTRFTSLPEWLKALSLKCLPENIWEPFRIAYGQPKKKASFTYKVNGFTCQDFENWGVSIVQPFVIRINRTTRDYPRGKLGLRMKIQETLTQDDFSVKMTIIIRKLQSYGTKEVDFVLGIGDNPFFETNPTNAFLVLRALKDPRRGTHKILLCTLRWITEPCDEDSLIENFTLTPPQTVEIEITSASGRFKDVIFVIDGKQINPPQSPPRIMYFWLAYDIKDVKGADIDIYIDFSPSIQD